jgi:hypothetical protein
MGLTACKWHEWVADARGYAAVIGVAAGATALVFTLTFSVVLMVPVPDGYGRPTLGAIILAAHVLPPLAYAITRLVRRIRALRRESFEWVDE